MMLDVSDVMEECYRWIAYPEVYIAATYTCSSDMNETLRVPYFWDVRLYDFQIVSWTRSDGNVFRFSREDFCDGRHCG